MKHRTLGMALVLCLSQVLLSPAQAAETVVMTAGTDGGASVSFGFDRDAKPRVITVRTVLAGVAGSKLSIHVDKAKTAAFSHIFAESECGFADGAGSTCLHTIPETSPAYAQIVSLFKLGKQARITVEDAGVMAMDHTASLIGFTKSFDN